MSSLSASMFYVTHQHIDLNIDIFSKRLTGKAELVIHPLTSDLRSIELNAQQCTIQNVTINQKSAPNIKFNDPYQRAKLPYVAQVHQYHMLQDRLESFTNGENELVITLPKSLRFEELDPNSEDAQSSRTIPGQTIRYVPFKVTIDYKIEHIRDGLQFVGVEPGDLRFPHAFTTNANGFSKTCCLFPCVDRLHSRCTWEIMIVVHKTVKDAIEGRKLRLTEGLDSRFSKDAEKQTRDSFTAEDEALEFTVVCTGELIDEDTFMGDPKKKSMSFISSKDLAPEQVGFCVGVFEHVDLAEFRDNEENDLLGQSAIPMHAYCLPGRALETKNACMPLARAMDYITLNYGSYPFPLYKTCFVDDSCSDILSYGTMSICANTQLFPPEVLDPIDPVTRTLVHALAYQWVGIDIIPKLQEDMWIIYGISYYVTGSFLAKLCGKNHYRYSQKISCNRVVDLDVNMPSLQELGSMAGQGSLEQELLTLKAPLILFILDQRLTKTNTSSGLLRIISRIFLNAKVGDLANGVIDTTYFIRQCERLGHTKLEQFFTQWVEGPGCPRFRVTQRFNKKKLVVEMSIQQVQTEYAREQARESVIGKQTFMRDALKDRHAHDYILPCFTGPMTIRIHEADGTPYEHIVEIKESLQKLEIPYNTKYKRLKRGRRNKERQMLTSTEYAADGTDDVLLYSLGDVLQSEEEMLRWRLAEWSQEDEERMSQESYEWVRMDADFEWICRLSLVMPGHMWVSQLQQDRDVVAQLESVEYLAEQRGHPLISTFLLRTLMDQRYFYGIRTAAAMALRQSARSELDMIGMHHLEMAFQELFCYPTSSMTRPNNFADRAAYLIQCSIPAAIARIRDQNGTAPYRVRKWLHDKLKYNDNSDNEYSDCYYIKALMEALATTVASKPPFSEDDSEEMFIDPGDDDLRFHQSCLDELDRYRKLDEWIPSYQNIITTTALNCIQQLVFANKMRADPLQLLQYTAEGLPSSVRIASFSVLLDLGLAKTDDILTWFLTALGTDPSPHFRQELILLLWRYLGSIAVGDTFEARARPPTEQIGLVVEVEASTETRRVDLLRKQDIAEAAAALRNEISTNTALQHGLWNACTLSIVSLGQLKQLLDICDLLYTPHTSMIIVLRLPRYWRCKRTGKGRVCFTQTSRVRTTPIPRRQIKIKLNAAGPAADDAGRSAARMLQQSKKILSLNGPASVQPGSGVLPRPLFKQSIASSPIGGVSTTTLDQAGPEYPGREEKPKLKIKLKLGSARSP